MDKAEELQDRYDELYWTSYTPEKEKQLLQIIKEAQKINHLLSSSLIQYKNQVTNLIKTSRKAAKLSSA